MDRPDAKRPGAPSPTPIRPMIRRLLGEDVELVVGGTSGGLVRADPGHIEQVIMNLAVNARDAMPVGGVLTFSIADVDLDEAATRELIGVSPGPHLLLTVSDTGEGMDRATQARIF